MNGTRILAGTAILVALVFSAPAAFSQAETKAGVSISLPEKWIAGWNSHDPEKLLPLFSADIFYEDVAFGEANHGTAELRKFIASELDAVPDLELKLLRASIHNGHGTIEWTFSGTDKGVYKTGKKFSVRGVSVVDLRAGKIWRNLDFYDAATIMRQVGVLPTSAGAR